jgi:diguanylate cyclase (GGDEF)-like protein
MEKLENQAKKQTAELPEHIRQKFQIMENTKAKLLDMAYTDKMTGVVNKDKLTSIIRDLINDTKVEKFSILIFDIDNFKFINDNMGHLIGDESLISLARLGEDSIRKNDYIGRYGGDEFVIVLPALDAYGAKMIAERFRSKVAQQTKPKFTISIGVSSYPEDGKSFKELIQAADKALYLSKERGKNRVSHAKLY